MSPQTNGIRDTVPQNDIERVLSSYLPQKTLCIVTGAAKRSGRVNGLLQYRWKKAWAENNPAQI